jgi:spermidine synthase
MQPRIGMYTLFSMKYLLPIIILIEGFASIAVEILTIRQLLPVAGGSVIVTSLIIGIFLLFLALGYERGGHFDSNLYSRLRRNFLISAIWIGVGLSYIFVKCFFDAVEKITGPHFIYSLVIYLLVILAPAIYLLGQTLPITMNIVRQDKLAGAIAGKALGVSTIGSFLGAIFTTLILMQYAGVAWTVFIVFIVLVMLVLLLSESKRSLLITSLIGLLSGIIIFYINIMVEHKKFSLTDTYANYSILTHENSPEIISFKTGKMLMINQVYSSYTDQNKNALPYIETIAKIIFDDLQLRNANILVLGAGGFTLSQNDAGQNHFTYVDIDSQIKSVVVPDFIPEIKDTLIIDDARHFLTQDNKKYDVIVIDVYSHIQSIPAYLITREFMQVIKNHLNEKIGYAIFNIIGNPMFNDKYIKRVDNTIRSVFGSCTITPVSYSDQLSNLIYACSNLTDVNDHVIYTDNMNTSTTDSFAW